MPERKHMPPPATSLGKEYQKEIGLFKTISAKSQHEIADTLANIIWDLYKDKSLDAIEFNTTVARIMEIAKITGVYIEMMRSLLISVTFESVDSKDHT